MQPVQGAREEGAKGFFKGLGKGFLGVVVKPIAGVLDFATRTAEGTRNTATMFEDRYGRRRPPRYSFWREI